MAPLGESRAAPRLSLKFSREYFFGIVPDYVSAGAGLMAFDKSVLTDRRAAIDGRFGDQIKQAIASAQDLGATIHQPDLKRVPAPYPADHRHADLLRPGERSAPGI